MEITNTPPMEIIPGQKPVGLDNALVYTSPTITKISAALSKAQAKIESAEKNAENPHFKMHYADLAAVLEAADPIFEQELSFTQVFSEDSKGRPTLITTLFHTSGEWIKSICPLIFSKQDMQGFGSAATYARRYSLSAMLGIAQADDDATAATAKEKNKNSDRGNQNQNDAPPRNTQPANKPAASAPAKKEEKNSVGKERQEKLMAHISSKSNTTAWTAKGATTYMQARFKKATLTVLTESEFNQLMGTVMNMAPAQADLQLQDPATEKAQERKEADGAFANNDDPRNVK